VGKKKTRNNPAKGNSAKTEPCPVLGEGGRGRVKKKIQTKQLKTEQVDRRRERSRQTDIKKCERGTITGKH